MNRKNLYSNLSLQIAYFIVQHQKTWIIKFDLYFNRLLNIYSCKKCWSYTCKYLLMYNFFNRDTSKSVSLGREQVMTSL